MKLYKTLSMRFSKFLTGTLVCLGIASCGTSQYFTSYSDGIYEDAAPKEVRIRTSDPNRTFSRGISELEIEPLYEEEGFLKTCTLQKTDTTTHKTTTTST